MSITKLRPRLCFFIGAALGLSCSGEPGAPHEEPDAGASSLNRSGVDGVPSDDVPNAVVALTIDLASRHELLVPVLAERPKAALRLHGTALIQDGLLTEGAPGGAAFDIGVEASARASGALTLFPLDARDHALTLTPTRATDASAFVTEDGRAVFGGAFGSADVVFTQAPNRLEHTLILRDEASPSEFAWKIDRPADLTPETLNDYATAFIDAAGNVRLTVTPAHLTDADGNRRAAAIRFENDGFARLSIDPRGLRYPAIVSFGIEAPPLGRRAPVPGVNVIKGQVLVLLDTSGSMVWRFDGSETTTHGDSPRTNEAVFCDNNIGTSFGCDDNVACTLANGGVNFYRVDDANQPSRMLASKAALQNVVNAHSGLLDFGLEGFAQGSSCVTRVNGTTTGRCVNSSNNTEYGQPNGQSTNITFNGSCGSSAGGGNVLVAPGVQSALSVLRYVDYVEDFCSSTGSQGGPPRNPELRGQGLTPLARAVRTARTSWYGPILSGGTDPQINCRPYVLVVMSDGEDTCGDSDDGDPSESVAALTALNGANPVKTYVLGMGDTSGLDLDELNEMAAAGLTSTAKLANNQQEIEAAFADIVAETVKFESCNNADDNCNVFIDEGLGVFQECQSNNDCTASCNSGRCTCSSDLDCDGASGYVCDQSSPVRFCRPRCTVVNGTCSAHGVRKCGVGPGQCCVDNGVWNCDEILTPPTGTPEVCNAKDDNCNGQIDEGLDCPDCIEFPEICNGKDDDCDTIVDENPIGTGEACGTDVGACEKGHFVCQNGKFVCVGGLGPYTEVCNALDDDCDKVVDGQTRLCYTPGLNHPTRNTGICHDGAERCIAETNMPGANIPGVECANPTCWGDCIGERTPETEICNGLDDDCDSATDEGLATPDGGQVGDACCLYQAQGEDLCGVGICEFGQWICDTRIRQVICVGGKGPGPEICNGLDDDCNGLVDDVPGQGTPCQTPSGCRGTLECDNQSGGLVCVPKQTPDPELCNGIDDDCDNSTDEEPDVLSDPALKGECQKPEPGHDEPPCKAGKKVCRNGFIDCEGSIGPGDEICNGIDDDCDGVSDDDSTCPDGSLCDDGECKVPCAPGEFPCPGGMRCNKKKNVCEPGNDAGSGGGGEGGEGGSAGEGSGGAAGDGSGGVGADGSGGESGGDGAGGEGADNGVGGNSTGGNGATPGVPDAGTQRPKKKREIYGLATGGGGFACNTGGARPQEPWLALALGMLLALARRRRRGVS